ncbi:WG repeat-containing protein [Alistipes shahii]
MIKIENIKRLYGFRYGLGEFQVKQGRKTLNGLLNAAGEIVLEPQPKTLCIIDENTVELYNNSGSKYKVLDLKSNNLYTFEHYNAQKYGGAITWQRGKGCGVVDINGNIMIPHKYRRLLHRADASYIASNCRNKYGLLDSCGSELIPFKYDYLESSLHPDRFSAKQGEYWFVINRSGQRLSEKRYDYLEGFTENGYAIFGEKQVDDWSGWERMRYGIIDKNERIAIPAIHDSLYWYDNDRLSCGYAHTWCRGRMFGQFWEYGVIDSCGNIVIPRCYSNNLFQGHDRTYIATWPNLICGGFMCPIEGIIDEAGHVVIPFRNWQIISFGRAFRIYDRQLKRCGLYSSSGEELLPFEFDHIDNLGDTLDYIAVCKKREWYYVNQRGERILL